MSSHASRDQHGGGQFVPVNRSRKIAKYTGNMENSGTPKRRRNSTGGTADALQSSQPTYAKIAALDLAKMTDSQKLDFLVGQVCSVQSLTKQSHSTTAGLGKAYQEIDVLTNKVTHLEDKFSAYEMRVIDLETRSRRNNLIFHNIPESPDETDIECEQTLVSFLVNNMGMRDTVKEVRFERVHRLGRRRPGVPPNGQPWRPRPIIAGFCFYKQKQSILTNSKMLKGTDFSINQDYPAEIRSARSALWDHFRKARSEKLKATIAYPSKLVVENEVVRDIFPGWGEWSATGQNRGQSGATATRDQVPVSGSPIHIPMEDLLSAQPFHPRHHLAPVVAVQAPPISRNATYYSSNLDAPTEGPQLPRNATSVKSRDAPPPVPPRVSPQGHSTPSQQRDGQRQGVSNFQLNAQYRHTPPASSILMHNSGGAPHEHFTAVHAPSAVTGGTGTGGAPSGLTRPPGPAPDNTGSAVAAPEHVHGASKADDTSDDQDLGTVISTSMKLIDGQ